MKLNKIFLSMAALAFLGAMTVGCSGDDLAAETPQLPNTTNGTVVTKVTVSLDEHASTRMLDPTGLKTFEEGDKIAVIYTNTAGVTVKAESDPLQATDLHDAKKTASFSVTLTNPQANTPVRYIYPAAMAADDVSATTPDNDATIKWTNLATQDGDFAFISEYVDLAVFDGTMTAQSNLPKTATLENQLTVGAFTIKNSGGTDITNTVTSLTISDGTNTYNVSPSTLSTIYVAMKPISDTQTVVVQATDGTAHYVKTVTGKTLAKNNITPVNVKMFTGTPASSALPANLGNFLGADGFIYPSSVAATTTGTTPVAVIAYVGSVSNYFNKFLAIALTDVDNSYHTCADALTKVGEYAAAHPITIDGTIHNSNAIGATCYDIVADDVNTSSATRTTGVVKGWRLPSVTDWRYIFDGLGRQKASLTLVAKRTGGEPKPTFSEDATPTNPKGVEDMMVYRNGDNGSSLRTAINTACGNDALQSNSYWSSSQLSSESNKAWVYYLQWGQIFSYPKTKEHNVRAVFAY